jgi:predicted histone-like DNA-binding protein
MNMAVPYDFFRTPQPKNKDKVRYHARVVVRDTMETEDIARMIASRSTIKEGDVTGTLVELAKVLFTELPEGRSIHIDGIGSVPTHRQFVPRKRFVPRAYSSKALFSHRKRS